MAKSGKFEVGDGRKRGGTLMSDEMRAIKCLTKAEVRRILNLFLAFPLPQVIAKLESPTTPMFELIFAKVLMRIYETGDSKGFSILLDRIVGPVKVDEPDIATMRAQVEAEVRLSMMPIEEVRALAKQAQGRRVIDVDSET